MGQYAEHIGDKAPAGELGVRGMEEAPSHVLVLVTASSADEAQAIARMLVEERLAACVNIIPGLRSLFRWQRKIEAAGEVLLLVKSRGEFLPSITERVKRLHSYTVPEVIALPILAGSPDYLAWIDESVG